MHTPSAFLVSSRPRGTGTYLPRNLGLLLATTIALALALLGAAPASAHAQLLETDPAEGAEVAEAPAQIVLTFNENIEQIGSDVVITDAQGTEVQDGDPQIDGHDVTQALVDDRPAGQYTVQWRVVSADGHPISGEFSFDAAAAAGGEVPDDPADDPAEDPAGTGDEDAGTDPDATDPAADPGDETTADATDETGDDAPADEQAESDEGGFPWGLIFALAGVAVVLALVVRARTQLRNRDASDSGPGTDRTDHTDRGDTDTNP